MLVRLNRMNNNESHNRIHVLMNYFTQRFLNYNQSVRRISVNADMIDRYNFYFAMWSSLAHSNALTIMCN